MLTQDGGTVTATPLWRLLSTHPRVSDRGRARWRLEDAREALAELPEGRHVRPLLAALADHSPFLWRLVEADPVRLDRILRSDPRHHFESLLAALVAGPEADEAGLMQRLRRTRQEVALLVALADLGGAWKLEEVLQALTRAADAFIRAALVHLLRKAGAGGYLRIDPLDPERGAGLVVLGMGKLGGAELNYSSDVDLVALYDPTSPALTDASAAGPLYSRIVRDLVRILQQPTADGHVLRVDLRLRPNPEASAAALSIEAALSHYEYAGQTWERAAFIKARPVAGDEPLGANFLRSIAPFLWRRFLDFGAIADIHAMKRRIHAVKGGGAIAVAGHNVKLGRGGIRDIEFFAQTQQLIYGGRHAELRGSRTTPALKALRRDGRISSLACDDLARAYGFLREVEHRLQMLDDAQTHTLPDKPAALERFSRFCGYSATAQFSEVLQRHLVLVTHHYGLLFEGARDGADAVLAFADPADDPDTLHRLAQLGFGRPDTVAAVVRGWLSGARQATRSPRVRELLPELVPKLLLTFSRTADPDGAVIGFDRSLERMPAAAELFTILAANDAVRTLYGEILGSAPLLARAVAAHPHLLDVALDPRADVVAGEAAMAARLAAGLAHLRDMEDVLDTIRDLQHEEHFLIGTRLLSGQIAPDEAAAAFTALAVGVVRALIPYIVRQLDDIHGAPVGSDFVLVAMGKLGSSEMTATSDLDLVLVYDFDPASAETNGPKPIPAPTYFARLTQRIISALSQPTRRGRLYEVDMRLRPSGRQGPLATRFTAFSVYQRDEAMTWEHMALTRARVIVGGEALGIRVATKIAHVLRATPRPRLRGDIAEMRALMRRERPPRDEWDLKLVPGGLVDIDFIAQFVALRDGASRPCPPGASTQRLLAEASSAGSLDAADRVAAAHRLLADTMQIMRLASEAGRSLEEVARGVKLRLVDAAGLQSFSQLKSALAQATAVIRRAFETLIDPG